MHTASRLHWTRGRVLDEGTGAGRTLEWVGRDEQGRPVARVVRVLGPVRGERRSYPAVALDDEARIIELRPLPPVGADWLACIGGKVVGRAALPLQAVRTVEAALG
ncbi:MAG TPA: hypothetical protein VHY76_01005 [Acetobacteraceae bacterium]|jgi:hypothetical protein|nr:hypothetical protein [Acetobacteraceae bacterium]